MSFFGLEESILAADEVGVEDGDFGVGKGIALALAKVKDMLAHTFLLNSQDMSQIGLEIHVILSDTLVVLLVPSDQAAKSCLWSDLLEQKLRV